MPAARPPSPLVLSGICALGVRSHRKTVLMRWSPPCSQARAVAHVLRGAGQEEKPMQLETLGVHAGFVEDPATHAAAVPIWR